MRAETRVPRKLIQEGGRDPVLSLQVEGFIRDRTAIELANMVIGLGGGLLLLLPSDILQSRPFAGFLTVAPEWFWAGVLLAWGGGTALAWLCPSWLRCRTWGMLGSVGLWGCLCITTAVATGFGAFISVMFLGQAIGCWWTYKRLVAHVLPPD